MSCDEGLDQFVESLEGHVVQGGPASLRFAGRKSLTNKQTDHHSPVNVSVLAKEHLADISVSGLCVNWNDQNKYFSHS